MKQSQQIIENAIFIDVQGTLIKGACTLNRKLYDNMVVAQQHGAEVIIFTMAAPKSMDAYLKDLGVDTNRFPVHNKFTYRGHLFTGLIVDDVAPHLQGFLTRPHVYDQDGDTLAAIVTQLSKSPRLTFETALQNHRITQTRCLKHSHTND